MANVQGSIEQQPFPASEAVSAVSSSSYSWWGLIWTVLFLILLLVVVLWIIRRMNRSASRSINVAWARVLDRQVLAGQQSLYLVEIAGKLQVLGGSDHHLVKLDEISDPDLAAEIFAEISDRPTERAEGWLNKLANRLFTLKQSKKSQDPFASELARLLEEAER